MLITPAHTYHFLWFDLSVFFFYLSICVFLEVHAIIILP